MPAVARPETYRGNTIIAAGRFVANRDPSLAGSDWPPTSSVSMPAVAGVNAPIHPKVIDTVTGFGGYRYWMAFTPYPVGNDDTQENPSIVASSDGDSWDAPSTNPIEPAPSGAAQGIKYNSDTHLLLGNGRLYLIWRRFDNSAGQWLEQILYRYSDDGVTWSESLLANLQTTNVSGISLLLSPSVEYYDGEYWCWTANRSISPIVIELRKSPNLNGPWSEPTICTLLLPDAAREPWHLDVVRVSGGWAMLIADRKRADLTNGRLWLAYSDKHGTEWTVRDSAFSTAAPNVYRSSLVRRPGGFDCWLTDWDARTIRRLSIYYSQV